MKDNQTPNRRDLIKNLTITAAVGIVGGAATIQGQHKDTPSHEASTLDYYRGLRKRGPGHGFSYPTTRYRR